MDRDIKFEVQYLLSLTLVVFGILSISTFRERISLWIPYSLIILLSLHFMIFNILYGYGHAAPFEIEFIETIDRVSRPTLLIISLTFGYFVAHVIFSVFSDIILQPLDFTSALGQTIIRYIVPLLLIGVMVFVFRKNVSGPFNNFEDVNLKVIPEFIRVFTLAGDTRPLTIKVENNGDSTFEYGLRVEIPHDVTVSFEDKDYQEEFTVAGSLEPGQAYRRSFRITHASQEHENEILTTVIEFGGGSQTREVELELIP